MHVILGALGLIVTILILIKRLSDVGIDIGWLDSFKWNRRRKWRQNYRSNPVFDIVGAVAGAIRFPVWKFCIYGGIGRIIKHTLVAFAGYWGVDFMFRFFG